MGDAKSAAATDLRFGRDLRRVQDENGVDLLLLRENLSRSVEERLIALEEAIQFAEEVQRVDETA